MNVFRQEIRANLKSTLLWTAVLTGISAMVLSFYPIFQKDLDNFVAVLNNFPDVMKSIMGMNAHIFFSPLEYYCFVLNFTLLFAGIQAMNLGVGIVSKETRDKTADFLMTKPISRTRILHAKILASTALLAATAAVYSVLIYPVFHAIADEFPDTSRYLLLCLAFFMLQMILFAVGLIVSVAARKIRSVLPVSLGLVFFFYAISAFAVTSDSDKLRFLTPFQYFKPEYVVEHGSYEMAYLVTGLVIIAVCISASYMWFRKKEIHAV